MQSKYFLFGHYLHKKRLITLNDIVEARLIQTRHNRKIGQIALDKGLLTLEEKEKILSLQEDTLKRFGEISIENNYLTEKKNYLRNRKIIIFFSEKHWYRLGLFQKKK
jgi:hypothetical protein